MFSYIGSVGRSESLHSDSDDSSGPNAPLTPLAKEGNKQFLVEIHQPTSEVNHVKGKSATKKKGGTHFDQGIALPTFQGHGPPPSLLGVPPQGARRQSVLVQVADCLQMAAACDIHQKAKRQQQPPPGPTQTMRRTVSQMSLTQSRTSLTQPTQPESLTNLHKQSEKREVDAGKLDSARQHLEEVRQRAIKLQRNAAEQRHQILKLHNIRSTEVGLRKQFLEEQKRLQRACSWLLMIATVNFADSASRKLAQSKVTEATKKSILPTALVRIRRALRRARERLYGQNIPKPTLAQIKSDKMLSLYSDHHINWLIEKLRIRYYFTNETIIFMGCEDDECYYLCNGSADVMMGMTKVFTLRGGMVFGSVGMISGEPRTATIVAREPCFVWYVTRKDFESYDTQDQQVVAAMLIINELRQKNIRSVYRSLLDANYAVTKFSCLRGVEPDFVRQVFDKGTPRVIKGGEVLLHPSKASESILVYVLRGFVRILLPSASAGSLKKPLYEYLSFLCDLSMKRLTGEDETVLKKAVAAFEARRASPDTSHPTLCFGDDTALRAAGSPHSGTRTFTKDGSEVVCELAGPMILNLPSIFMQEVSPFAVDTVGGCDVVQLSREVIMAQDILELALVRQNVLNIRTEFLEVPNKNDLLKILFRGSLSFGFLSTLKSDDCLEKVPWCFAQGDVLEFSEKDDMEALIILSGSLDDGPQHDSHHVSHPYLWPEIHFVYFGNVVVRTKTLSRVDAVKIKRAHLLEWLFSGLSEADLGSLVTALTNSFVSKTGKRPVFSDYGIEDFIGRHGGGGKALINKYRSFRALNAKAVSYHQSVPLFKPGVEGAAKTEQFKLQASQHNSATVEQRDEQIEDKTKRKARRVVFGEPESPHSGASGGNGASTEKPKLTPLIEPQEEHPDDAFEPAESIALLIEKDMARRVHEEQESLLKIKNRGGWSSPTTGQAIGRPCFDPKVDRDIIKARDPVPYRRLIPCDVVPPFDDERPENCIGDGLDVPKAKVQRLLHTMEMMSRQQPLAKCVTADLDDPDRGDSLQGEDDSSEEWLHWNSVNQAEPSGAALRQKAQSFVLPARKPTRLPHSLDGGSPMFSRAAIVDIGKRLEDLDGDRRVAGKVFTEHGVLPCPRPRSGSSAFGKGSAVSSTAVVRRPATQPPTAISVKKAKVMLLQDITAQLRI